MVSTVELVFIIILGIALAFVLWFFIVAKNYSSVLNSDNYARGANKLGSGDIDLKCNQGHIISTINATQICTNPESIQTNSPKDYGKFDPNNTVDLTSDLQTTCDGKQTCTYNFDPQPTLSGSCTNPQFISTYLCVPK